MDDENDVDDGRTVKYHFNNRYLLYFTGDLVSILSAAAIANNCHSNGTTAC